MSTYDSLIFVYATKSKDKTKNDLQFVCILSLNRKLSSKKDNHDKYTLDSTNFPLKYFRILCRMFPNKNYRNGHKGEAPSGV